MITDETLLAVREALKTQFRKAVEGSSGETFEATKVTMPQDLVWDAYARAALTAALPLIRGAVVEEAIEACKKQERDFLDPAYTAGQPLASFSERFACDQCARAIRTLSPREAGE